METKTQRIDEDLSAFLINYAEKCTEHRSDISVSRDLVGRSKSIEVVANDNVMSSVLMAYLVKYCELHNLGCYCTVKNNKPMIRVFWYE